MMEGAFSKKKSPVLIFPAGKKFDTPFCKTKRFAQCGANLFCRVGTAFHRTNRSGFTILFLLFQFGANGKDLCGCNNACRKHQRAEGATV